MGEERDEIRRILDEMFNRAQGLSVETVARHAKRSTILYAPKPQTRAADPDFARRVAARREEVEKAREARARERQVALFEERARERERRAARALERERLKLKWREEERIKEERKAAFAARVKHLLVLEERTKRESLRTSVRETLMASLTEDRMPSPWRGAQAPARNWNLDVIEGNWV